MNIESWGPRVKVTAPKINYTEVDTQEIVKQNQEAEILSPSKWKRLYELGEDLHAHELESALIGNPFNIKEKEVQAYLSEQTDEGKRSGFIGAIELYLAQESPTAQRAKADIIVDFMKDNPI